MAKKGTVGNGQTWKDLPAAEVVVETSGWSVAWRWLCWCFGWLRSGILAYCIVGFVVSGLAALIGKSFTVVVASIFLVDVAIGRWREANAYLKRLGRTYSFRIPGLSRAAELTEAQTRRVARRVADRLAGEAR